MKEAELDTLLAQARTAPRDAPPGLMDRVLADGLALQSTRHAAAREPARRGRFWHGFLEAIGGRGALAGLMTAAVAGLWLGLAAPAPVAALTESLLPAEGPDMVELLSDDNEVLENG